MRGMARSIRPFVDQALGGTLDSELRERRERGESFDSIARWLAAEHGIDVTSETIRNWVAASTAEVA